MAIQNNNSNITLTLDEGHNLNQTSIIDFSEDNTTSEPIVINTSSTDTIDESNLPLPPPPATPATPDTPVSPINNNTVNSNTVNSNTVNNNDIVEVKEISVNISKYLEECYDRLVELVNGTEYDLTNWTLLIVKALKCVAYVKGITPEEQVELGLEIIILYLDNNTEITDEELVFIKQQAEKLVWNILEGQGANKKNHKKNEKGFKKVQKRMDKNSKKMDIDVLASPLQIVNTIINKIETTVKARKYDADGFITALPGTIMNIVSLIDKYKHLTRVEKKNLIIQAIQKVLKTKAPEWFKIGEKQQKSLDLLASSLPQLVETCVGVANGDIDFKVDFNNPASFMNIFKYIMPLFALCRK